ncbi:hypothetical protein BH10BAC5_BH10BAC5_25260 [soil metagenome]
MKKIVSLLILSIFISIWGCSDNTITPGITDISGSYDCPVGSSTGITNYYSMDLTQNGNTLSGKIQSYDSAKTYKGTLSGTFDGTNISFISDLEGTAYDFTFTGTLSTGSPRKLSGAILTTVDNAASNVDFTESTVIEPIDTTRPPNKYIFKTDYESPNQTGQSVIFVHGMGTTLLEWDSLIASLTPDFKSRHNIYRFQYDWQTDIETNGIILKDSIIAKGIINPILIGHSMGGLVSRAYVKNGGSLTKLVTLGTPNYGSPLARLKYFVSWLALPGPQDLVPTSPFLAALNSSTLDIANRSKYYNLAGRMGISFSASSGKWEWNENYYSKFIKTGYYVMKLYYPTRDNDGLVSENSALFDDGGTHRPLGAQLWVDHMDEQFPQISSGMFNYILAQ